MPPSERMTKIGACTLSARTPRATRSRYARTIGDSAALTTVVEKRSYSRYCGSTSDESEYFDAGDGGGQRVGDGLLVSGVDVSVQQPDRNGGDPALAERRDRRVHRAPIELDQGGAVVRAPLAHDQPVLAPRQRLGPRDVQVVDRTAVLPPDLQHVPKPFGRDERHSRQLEVDLPEQRVRRDGAGMRNERHLTRRDVRQQRAQRLQQPVFGRLRRRRHLETHQPPVVLQRDEVGEGPADVDSNAPAHAAPIPKNASCTSGSPIKSLAIPSRTTLPVCST